MNSDLPHLRGLTESAGKNLDVEARWARLNELLAPVEATLEADVEAPKRPIVFILGPPRSGSTLLSQVLAATGSFGVTSNFVARFWRAPALGFQLEQALGNPKDTASFQSERGRTMGQSEPHEFGYFWSGWFDLGQETHALSAELLAKVDIAGLKRSLGAMEASAGKPLMLKNNTWFSFQASWLAAQFPTGIFVACTRDPFFVAQSIYAQRVVLGDPARWWSVRPSAYPDITGLPPLEQVAAQTVEIQREMQKVLASVPRDRLIRADYQRLCDNPRDLVDDIFRACAKVGDIPKPAAAVPEKFETTNRIRLASMEAERLQRLVADRLADN